MVVIVSVLDEFGIPSFFCINQNLDSFPVYMWSRKHTPWRIHICYVGVVSKLSSPQADPGWTANSRYKYQRTLAFCKNSPFGNSFQINKAKDKW